jgi:2-iminobutanoate/2-iminopropanoate deaminase
MNMDDFGKINTVYASYFNEQLLLERQSSSLFTKNVNVEISMIAIR